MPWRRSSGRYQLRGAGLARPEGEPPLCPGGTLRPLEGVLTLLTRAGFSGTDALHIYRALFGFLHGHVLDELQELVEKPDETDDLFRLGLHRLPVGEFPCSAAWPPSWPPTTAPPDSNAASTSCSPGSPPS
jgi:hypothetical protein